MQPSPSHDTRLTTRSSARLRTICHRLCIAACLSLADTAVAAAGPPAVTLEIDGLAQTVFDSTRDGCEGIDTPDLNPRAFRDARNQVVFFGLHFVNRALRGPDLAHVKLECEVVLGSAANPDPAAFDSRNYIAATWTVDGMHVAAIIHHEYHADQFGTCQVAGELGCWYNAILAFVSGDGGRSFAKAAPAVLAAAPFRQDMQQGRHRGFFNPSNIFGDGKFQYFFASTTGWDGQPFGACLFRNADPLDAAGWRAFDGTRFAAVFPDPYGKAARSAPTHCRPIAPFTLPVGAVVRLRVGGSWLAIWQASRDGDIFPLDGFYYATSTNLTLWSEPRLFVAGQTLYNGACGAKGTVLAYPSLLDEAAEGRNFDDSGNAPWLYYTEIDAKDCAFTGPRRLMRVRLKVGQ